MGTIDEQLALGLLKSAAASQFKYYSRDNLFPAKRPILEIQKTSYFGNTKNLLFSKYKRCPIVEIQNTS